MTKHLITFLVPAPYAQSLMLRDLFQLIGSLRQGPAHLSRPRLGDMNPSSSVADSVAVNDPITRSTSLGALSTSPPNYTNGSVNGDTMAAAVPSEPLAAGKVERFAQDRRRG